MGVRADGNPAPGFSGQPDEIDAHILTIRIRIDLDCLVQFGGDRKNMCPIGAQSQPKVINAPARVTQYLYCGIAECRYITVGLIVFLPEGGMKAAQNDVELTQL
jgi:hypothetical protein